MAKGQQKRATFEDVCRAQDKLLAFIDKCIDDNKALNKYERKEFIEHFRFATLGLGSEHIFIITSEKRSHTIGNVGHAAYWLAYRTNTPISLSDDVIEIKDFWLKLRDYCFKIFPLAQEMSIKISKEQTRFGSSEAGMV